MKRAIFGTIVNILAAAAGVVGIVYYIINANTTYFSGLGINPVVIGCVAAGIVAVLFWCFAGEPKKTWKDILPIIAPALFICGMLTLVNSRVNGIAAIMTFENNAQNMAYLQSCFVALGAMAAAAVLSCIAAFCNVKKA